MFRFHYPLTYNLLLNVYRDITKNLEIELNTNSINMDASTANIASPFCY